MAPKDEAAPAAGAAAAAPAAAPPATAPAAAPAAPAAAPAAPKAGAKAAAAQDDDKGKVRVKCELENASELINGVKFQKAAVKKGQRPYMLSEPVSQEVADKFATIMGYSIV